MEEYEDWMGDVDEEAIRLRNLVRAYLQDTIPDYTSVLIDVSWWWYETVLEKLFKKSRTLYYAFGTHSASYYVY